MSASYKYYIIVNYGSISPRVHGPFKSDENRVKWARRFRHRHFNDDLIRLTITPKGTPVVDSFYGYEMPEEDR